MYLKDFSPGDQVYLYVDANGTMELAESNSGRGPHASCHILMVRQEDVIVGWKLGESQPLANYNVRIKYAKDEGNCYPGFVAWALLSRLRRTPGLVLLEGPCRQCSKNNSTLDKRCWWCQVTCPTDLKRTGP